MSEGRRRVEDRLAHILEACQHIRSDAAGLTEQQFLADGKTQRAVIESIVVIGEASRKIMTLEPALEHSHAALWQQFRDAADMRNLLTHEYFRVDPSIVWTTIKHVLPGFEGLLIEFPI